MNHKRGLGVDGRTILDLIRNVKGTTEKHLYYWYFKCKTTTYQIVKFVMCSLKTT